MAVAVQTDVDVGVALGKAGVIARRARIRVGRQRCHPQDALVGGIIGLVGRPRNRSRSLARHAVVRGVDDAVAVAIDAAGAIAGDAYGGRFVAPGGSAVGDDHIALQADGGAAGVSAAAGIGVVAGDLDHLAGVDLRDGALAAVGDPDDRRGGCYFASRIEDDVAVLVGLHSVRAILLGVKADRRFGADANLRRARHWLGLGLGDGGAVAAGVTSGTLRRFVDASRVAGQRNQKAERERGEVETT